MCNPKHLVLSHKRGSAKCRKCGRTHTLSAHWSHAKPGNVAGVSKLAKGKRYAATRTNPPMQVYADVKHIVAKKGPGHRCDAACKRANHTYIHRFKPGVQIFGMPDGSLKVISKK